MFVSAAVRSLLSCLAAVTLSACTATMNRPLAIGLIGDAPYSPQQEAQLAGVIAEMNAKDLDFVVHIGDLQVSGPGYRQGIPPCTDEALENVRTLLSRSRHPLVITPGDNDWTDCHQATPPAEPQQRLERIRTMFFLPAFRPLGAHSLAVISQAGEEPPLGLPENLLWSRDEILFVTLHLVGSNNNLGRTPAEDAEHRSRTEATIRWLRHAFARAKAESSKGVMIFTHANPYFEDRWPRFYTRLVRVAPPPDRASGFTTFLAALEEEVAAYAGPVVLVHGDSHYFRVDKPLFRAADGELVPNFTRVETFGSPYVHWVEVTVDPSAKELFSFRPHVMR